VDAPLPTLRQRAKNILFFRPRVICRIGEMGEEEMRPKPALTAVSFSGRTSPDRFEEVTSLYFRCI
jgi:hypothetical protein